MGRKGESATQWAFQHIYKRAPTPEELAEYEWALHLERIWEWPDHWLTDADRADLAASDPGEAKRIFTRLANPSGTDCQPKHRSASSTAASAVRSASRRDGEGERVVPVTSKPRPPAPTPERRGRAPRVRQARALLREQLAGGPKPGVLVEAAAKEAEIPKRDLLAATDALRVRTQRGQWWLPGG